MSEHLIAGTVGGFVGTIAMSMLMMPAMGDKPGAPQMLLSRLNDKPPEDNKAMGMVLHFLYGTIAGIVFAYAAVDLLGYSIAEPSEGAVWGLVWGLVLFFVAFFWMAVSGMMSSMMDQPKSERMKGMVVFLVAHLIYGGVLGLVAAAMIG